MLGLTLSLASTQSMYNWHKTLSTLHSLAKAIRTDPNGFHISHCLKENPGIKVFWRSKGDWQNICDEASYTHKVNRYWKLESSVNPSSPGLGQKAQVLILILRR